LNENHHLLVKLSYKGACENLDVLCVPFAANIAVVIVTATMIAYLYCIYTLLMYTNTRSTEAE